MEFGYKRLTPENWLQPDPISSLFVRVRNGLIDTPTPDEWAEMFLRPQLASFVPEEVRALFNVARGVMAYGYLYYPLYELGIGQMYRVADAATVHKCNALGAPGLPSFHARIRWLRDQGVLSEAEADWWDATRRLRNWASHAQRPSVEPPGPVLGRVRRIVEAVNALFDETSRPG